MKPARRNTMLGALAAGACLMAGTASASVLQANLSVDNGYVVYISTNNATAGTQFGQANNWFATYGQSTSLNTGTDYYLHVYAYDQGGIAGFLGQFSLTGTDHVFANGQSTLLTNMTDWMGNTSGFGNAYGSLTDLGPNGTGPWGTRPNIANGAEWLWAGDAWNNDVAYFTTTIHATGGAVPEPGSVALLGLGLLGMAALRRRSGK